MNRLVCECSHLRKDHESGKEKISDSSISNCMTKDCACKGYHANYETRKQIWKIRFKALFWSGLIVIGVVIAGSIGYSMINFSTDTALANYNISEKSHLMNKWSNGTLTNSTNWYTTQNNPKELLVNSAFDPLLFVLFFIGLLASVSCYFSIMEDDYRRLIHE